MADVSVLTAPLPPPPQSCNLVRKKQPKRVAATTSTTTTPRSRKKKQHNSPTKKISSPISTQTSKTSTADKSLTTSWSSTTEDDELELFNPNNQLLTREFVESTLSKLCGYGVKIGANRLPQYQQCFVHKSVYRKDISPPTSVVDEYLRRTGRKNIEDIPLRPGIPLGTWNGGAPVVFTENYEDIEFVGDGWIGAVIGQYARNRFPQQSEEFYHNIKKHIVSKDGLSRLSKILGFGSYALLSPQAEDLLTRNNPSLLEDMFEAFCCAVVDDLGVGVLKVAIKNLIESSIDFRDVIINEDNYKDVLKRLCRENGWNQPGYLDLGDNGRIGDKREYSCGVLMIPEVEKLGVRSRNGFNPKGELCDLWSTGSGITKKKAQMNAAFNALKCLEVALAVAQ